MKSFNLFVGLLAVVLGMVIVHLQHSRGSSEPSLVNSVTEMFFYFSLVFCEKLGMASRYTYFRLSLDDSSTRLEEMFKNFKNVAETSIEDTTISGIPVRIFQPTRALLQSQKQPAIIFFHGGGLTSGSVKWSIISKTCFRLSQATNSMVISLEYRLAPEHIFPAQFQDCYAVVSTIIAEPTKFNVDKDKIVMVGDSAGGMLAAAVSLELVKEKKAKHIAAQVLLYPWLQSVDTTCLPSYQGISKITMRHLMGYFTALAITGKPDVEQEYISGNISQYFMSTPHWKYLKMPGMVLNCQPQREKFIGNFPSGFIESVVDYRFSPLLADTVAGLPPTLLVTVQHDVLASENVLFAYRLKKEGVPVINKIYNAAHGFLAFIDDLNSNQTKTPVGTQAMLDVIDYVNSVFYEN